MKALIIASLLISAAAYQNIPNLVEDAKGWVATTQLENTQAREAAISRAVGE